MGEMEPGLCSQPLTPWSGSVSSGGKDTLFSQTREVGSETEAFTVWHALCSQRS